MARPVYDVFEHFLPSTHKSSLRGEAEAIHNCNKSDSKHGDNLSLLTSRQTQVIGDDEFNTTFVSDKIVDLNFYRRGGEAVSPLYLKNTKTAQKNLKKQTNLFEEDDIFQGKDKIENFTPEFREFIDSKYGEHFSPEAILGYIYAVLFHKDYREKYLDFLKIDFPKIPFVESKEKFLALSELGQELIDLHLMRAFIGGGAIEVAYCNIGLNVARQSKLQGSWQYAMATNLLVDLSMMGGGNTGAGHIFPLYLYNTQRARKFLCK